VEYYLRLGPNRCHCFELEFLPGADICRMAMEEGILKPEEYEEILKGSRSASYNFGGSIQSVRIFKPYIVLLEMMPFLPAPLIRLLLRSRVLFRAVRLIPFKYIVLARIMNTIKDRRDIEGIPHYRKYLEGIRHIRRIKRMLRKGRSAS
jgi:hypothetical protein